MLPCGPAAATDAMKKTVFTGAATALVTPFRDDRIDYAILAQLIEMQIQAGIDALVIAGTTGEASTMPDDEHIELIAESVKIVAGRVPVIAGTGSNDTIHGVRLSTAASQAGADALLHVTPYYNKTNQKGLAEHFKRMASAVDIPIILYNVPSRTALNIDPKTYLELADVENIVAIKECNIAQVPETISLCGNAFTHYSGEDALVVPLLSLGGKGVISVVSNLIPAEMSRMVKLWMSGEIKAAASEQIRLMPLIKACFSDVNPIPVKAAMGLMGFETGSPRLPLLPLTTDAGDALLKILRDFDLLNHEVN